MRKANHLADEKSPYLQQHAHNPVDWYPWGEPAFARARAEGKPIFLSIGYSTCHWCHVMEKESFEDERVAALLNADFIPIKVDREERPDVDRIYMTAMQAMGLGGGWPLNVFLTPTLAPFYGGTYFPPETIHDRIGMFDLLPQVAKAWREDPTGLETNGTQLLGALAGLAKAEAQADAAPYEALFTRAFDALETSCDRTWGGFGRAPKFPTVVNLNFLAREAARVAASDPSRAASARAMARLQLDAMRAGGIHDHLGGGFHRYSVDARWLVPHFEKMLYDQAQLACAYLDVFQLDGQGADAAIARGVFDYVARDLTGAHGAFLSAEDADSEGEEGRFYAWTPAGLRDVLGEEDAQLFARRYGVTEDGNFEHATSVLHEAESLGAAAAVFGIEPGAASARLADARARLFEAREKRVRPHRDDKVIVSWNGLMISAFARGAGVLGDRTLAERAERAATFVWDTLYDEATGGLARRWRDGEAGGQGQLDDYAFLARGLIDVFQATFDPVWLERALTLTDEMIARFADDTDGAFFESPAGDPSIRVRMKDGFDGAEMAGNSLAALVLVDLAALTGRADLRQQADRALALYARRLAEHPIAMPQMLVAMARALEPARHVVIVAGKAGAAGEDCAALVSAYHRAFRPHDLLIVVDSAKTQARLARLASFIAPLVAQGGRATAYVCRDYACRAPVTDPAAFAAALDGD